MNILINDNNEDRKRSMIATIKQTLRTGCEIIDLISIGISGLSPKEQTEYFRNIVGSQTNIDLVIVHLSQTENEGFALYCARQNIPVLGFTGGSKVRSCLNAESYLYHYPYPVANAKDLSMASFLLAWQDSHFNRETVPGLWQILDKGLSIQISEEEDKLLRELLSHMAKKFGLSYEQFREDYKQFREDRAKFRAISYHNAFYDKDYLEKYKMEGNIFDFLLALKEKNKMQCDILIIDNNLWDKRNKETLRVLADLSMIEKNYPYVNFYLCGKTETRSNGNDEIKKIREKKGQGDFEISAFNKEKDNWGIVIRKKLSEFDIILQDLFLGEDMSGEEFLPIYIKEFPFLPVFIYSSSNDFDIIKNTLKKGADFFLPKDETLSLPYRIIEFQNDIGELTLCLNTEKKRNLIGNIRNWRNKPDYLWFGDKCYHMINHSYLHTTNDWKNLNQVLTPLIDETHDLLIVKNEDWLYPLSMAVWLHDIGHKGNERYGAAHEIRDNHGYISAEYILKYPELLGIIEDDKERESYYKDRKFGCSDNGPALDVLFKRRRENNQLSNAEKIALICAYHKSNMPLTMNDYNKLASDPNKYIPLDIFRDETRNEENVITLRAILEKVYEDDNDINKIISIVTLFRFIDAMDISYLRVGDESEKELKMKVIKNDLEYELTAIKKSLEILLKADPTSSVTGGLSTQDYYKSLRNKILEGNIFDIKAIEKKYHDQEEYEDFLLHTHYASFISIQPTHFDFHSSIEDMKIIYNKNQKFHISLKTSKSEIWLKETIVKERGKKDTSVFNRLVGKEDCYIFNELMSDKKYLAKDFIKEIQVELEYAEAKKSESITWP